MSVCETMLTLGFTYFIVFTGILGMWSIVDHVKAKRNKSEK